MLAKYFLRRAWGTLPKLTERLDQAVTCGADPHLGSEGLPDELTGFVQSVNRLVLHYREQIDIERELGVTAAHELRTPLHVMLLELGKIDDPCARRLEGDVVQMNRLIDRIMCHAHLAKAPQLEKTPIDLSSLVNQQIERLRILLDRWECQLVAINNDPEMFDGDLQMIGEAVCCLIETICSQPHLKTVPVTITSGPGCEVVLQYDGTEPLLDSADTDYLTDPLLNHPAAPEGTDIGLVIIKRTAMLHGGKVRADRINSGGHKIELRLI